MALVQTKTGNGGGYVNSYTIALTSSATAGSLLVFNLTASTTNTISSLTDSNSNTWTLAVSSAGTDRTHWIYYAANVASGATTLTLTFGSGQFADSTYTLREYDGMATAPLDQTVSDNSATGYVNSHPTGTTAATTQADELIIAAVGSSGSSSPAFTVPSGFGNLQAQSGFDVFTYHAVADKVVSATGTQTATFGSTGYVRSASAIATFKFAAPAANNSNFFPFF